MEQICCGIPMILDFAMFWSICSVCGRMGMSDRHLARLEEKPIGLRTDGNRSRTMTPEEYRQELKIETTKLDALMAELTVLQLKINKQAKRIRALEILIELEHNAKNHSSR